MKRTCCIAIAAVALGVLAAASSVQAQTKKITYAITDLGVFPSNTPYSSPASINSQGQIVGWSYKNDNARRACLWERVNGAWVMRDLGTLEPNYSSGTAAINDLGQVTGWGDTSTVSIQAYFYDNDMSGMESLPVLPGYDYSWGHSINTWGQIAGQSRPINLPSHAMLWEYDTQTQSWIITDLGLVSGRDSSAARGNNDQGQVVGWSYNGSVYAWRASFWENEANGWTFTDLNDIGVPSQTSMAHGINELGQVVGEKTIGSTNYFASLWERVDGQWTLSDLSAVKAFSTSKSSARAINNSGKVVGFAYLTNGDTVGFLYQGGVMYDLNSFLPTGAGWLLTYAHGINDQGQIVTDGRNPAGVTHAILMDTRQATYSYTSTGSAVAIKDNAAASKAMTLTDNVTITDLNVKVTLSHTRYADLKFELIGPDNVTRLLCAAGAVTGSGTKTLVFDDDGTAGSIVPALALSYYDGKSTLGKWTLKISDTVKNSKTGSFTSFTLDVVPAL
jgi:probable HAF family extracellular repeat protein